MMPSPTFLIISFGTAIPSSFSFAANHAAPSPSIISNGPFFQLVPRRIASSTSAMLSAISGTSVAA
jgi:hypothetical protein